MPTLIQTVNGTVTGLWGGSAMVRSPDGKVRMLHLGDQVQKGDAILTTQDGIVQLTPEESPIAASGPVTPDTELDRVISEVDRPTDETAPAAGLTAGDGGGLSPGYRVGRISEGVTPASFAQTNETTARQDFPERTTAPEDELPRDDTPAGPTVALSTSAAAVTEGGSIVYTATVSQPVTGSPLVITLTNGATVTIPVGQTTGSSAPVPVRADDAYSQGTDTLVVGVAGNTGGGLPPLTGTPPVQTLVQDDADATTITLTASSGTVAEGGSVTYTASVNNPVTGSPLVITLSNGATITIPVGASTGTSGPAPVRPDDAYTQGTQTLTVGVAGTTGGNFEALVQGAPVTTTVTDNTTPTTVTLTASAASVVEGGSITYTATLSNPVTGAPVVLTLSNGQTITIPVGASSGNSAPFPVRADDAYVQGTDTLTVGVSTATGGNFESLPPGFSTATTTVTDNTDATTVSVSASAASVTEGGSIVYTATVGSPVTGSPLVVTLSNGSTITIPVGQSSGTSAPVPVRPDDAHAQGTETLTVSVTGTTGGNFEAVTPTGSAVTTVTDDADATSLTLTPSAASVVEGGSITYTATLGSPVTGSPLVIALTNGLTITIPVGQSSGTSAPFAVRPDDADVQGTETVTVGVAGTTGGNFEAVAPAAPASTTVTDDTDTTSVTLTASAASVVEGGSIVYTVTLGNPVSGSPLVVTLTNGQTITVPVGQSSGSSTPFAVRADDAYAQGVQTLNVGVVSTTGGSFEAVGPVAPVSTAVTDDADATTVSISASAASVTEGGSIVYTATVSNPVSGSPLVVTLSNGQTITIPVGQSSASGTPFTVRPDDAHLQGTDTLNVTATGTTGGNFEAVTATGSAVTTVTDDSDVTTVTLTATATVAEGGSIVYVASLTSPAQTPVTVLLSNGASITIAAGASTGSTSVPAPTDDVYVDAGSVSATIASATGGNFEQLTVDPAPATTSVTDTLDVTTISITGAASAPEGSAASYTVSLTNPAQTAVTVSLTYSGTASNGVDFTGVATVTIPAGASSANFSIATIDDTLAEGAESFTITIGSATGGNFENLAVSGTNGSITTGIVDNDIASVSLSATPVLTEAGGTIVYTATVTQAPTSNLVVTLSNGATITVLAGQTSGTVNVPLAASDDVYVDPTSVSATITGTTGGGIPIGIDPAPAVTQVVDTIDTTTVTLNPSAASVAEGGSITYTASVNNVVTGSPLVLTLSNGQTITIPVGQSSGTSAPFNVRPDNAYTQADDTVTVSITGRSGGNFEALDTTGTATTTVTDNASATTVTLSTATASVAEGGSIVYTATVNNPVTGSPLVVNLSNGQSITIPVGQSSANSAPFAVRPDDAYVQGTQALNVTIGSTSGGAFEAMTTAGTATTAVTDDTDSTTVSLTASTANVHEGGSVVYTATVSQAVTGSPLVLTLSNGQTITIPVGDSSASSAPFNVRPDDVQRQGDETLTVTVTGNTGGNYEAFDRSGASASTVVSDDSDATVITLTASATSVTEGGSITYTATLGAPVAGTPLVITLTNGQTITIPVGQSGGTSAAFSVRADDAYVQGTDTLTVGIASTTGGTFEALTATSTATTSVTDDADATTVSISASAASVTEGGSVVYTATVSNPVTGSPLVVALSNGQTITIPVGQSSASGAPFTVRPDDLYLQGDQTLTVTATGTTGGNFEAVTPTGSATTTVADDTDATTVSLSASPTVAEGGSITYTATLSAAAQTPVTVVLSNGATITIAAGASTGSATAPAPADDVYVDAGNVSATIVSANGGNFEQLTINPAAATTAVTDTIDTATVSITGAASVGEGNTASYTVSLTHPAQTAVTVNLTYSGTATNGVDFTGVATVTIPAGASSANFSIATIDDTLAEGAESFTITIGSATGGNFENLAVSGTSGSITTGIVDNDTSNVSLSATPTLTEAGGVIVYTATVTQAPTANLLVTLSNGATITVLAGQTTGTVNVPLAASDDVYIDPTAVSATITGTTGGGIAIAIDPSAAVTQVVDTIDTTTVTLTPSAASVTEGGSIAYTATVNNAVTGSPLVLTLSNGQTITIPVGQSSGTSAPFNVRPDNAYTQADDTVTVSITGRSGGNFEALDTTDTATTTVTDNSSVTTVALSASPAAVEGGTITYTATLNNAVTGSPLVISLTNGQTITIPVGQSSGTVSIPVADDVYVQGARTVTAGISGTTGGNFENLNVSGTASTSVTDDADATTVTLDPSAAAVGEGGSIVYTATVNNPVTGSPLVLTLSNGQTITIPVGQSSGTSAPFNVRPDDAYAQGTQTLTVSVTGHTGGNFEALTTTDTAVTTVSDVSSTTTVTVTPSASTVAEGGAISYTVAVNNPVTGSPFAVTLSNGQTITIPVGQSSATGAPVPVRPDDAYEQGTQTVAVGINGTSGGNFEVVDSSSTASTTVTDDGDVTTLTLIPSAASVTEGGSITYTATLSNAVTGTPVVLTLSNGQTITIAVGQTQGTSAPFNVRADDFYVQGTETLNVTVTGRTGGDFESLNTAGTATTTVTDDADATIVTVAPSATTVVEGGAVAYTVSVNHAVTGSPFVVTLSNGQVLTIPVGQSSVTGPSVAVRPDDVYVQGTQTVSVGINSTSGGNFEAVTTTSTASTTVTDDSDVTTMTLTPSAASVAEGGSITYTATLSNAVTGTPVVLTLSNGQTITIPVGQTTGTSAPFNVRADDAYVQGTETLNVTVTNRTGGNFESLNTAGTATTTVTDDTDATTVTVAPSASTVVEGGAISYTVSVNNPVTGSPFAVTLSNGQTITIPVGASSATGPAVVLRPDDVQVQGTQTVAVSINSTSGGAYEAVDATSTASTTVTDDSDVTTLTLVPSAASVVEGGSLTYTATLSNAVAGSPVVLTLSNGQTITIPVGQTQGTSAPFNVRADDFYVQGTETLNVTVTNRTGGNFESLNTSGTATTTVTDDADATVVTVAASAASVVEGTAVSYTVSVNNPVTGSPFAVTLSNGQTITIPVGASSATGPAVVLRPDDAYVQGSQNVSVGVDSTSGGNFEALTTTSTASTTVTDDNDPTSLTLTPSAASVVEGGSIIYTATLSNAVTGSPVLLTLSNGQTITIPVGQTTGTSAAFNVRADDAYVQGTDTLNVTVTGRSGGNFESLNTAGTATTTVTDDADATAVTVTASASSVAEGVGVAYTVAVNNPVTGSPFVVTLSNGQVITIPVGQSSATGPAIVLRSDDVHVQGTQTVSVGINNTSGGNFEALTTTSTASTTVTDDTDVTTMTLTPSAASVTEGGSITYTATLSSAVTGTPVVLTLSNGQTITIPVGQTSGTSAPFNVRADDFYVQGTETLNVTVTNRTGGNFESLNTSGTATTTVTDDADATVVTVTPSATTVVEGSTIAYTVSVNNPVTGSPFVVTLSNGQVLTIPVGQSSVTGPAVATRPDDAYVQGLQTVAVSINGTSGGNYEAVNATSTASTTVTDDSDVTSLTLTPSAASVTEGGSITYTATLSNAVAGSPVVLTLSNGQSITIPVGQTQGTSAPFNVRADDAYVQGTETLAVTVTGRTGGNFESLNTAGTATTTVTDDAGATVVTVAASAANVVEGSAVSYTVTVNNPVTGTPFAVTLSNGQTITIPVGASSATGPAVVLRPDDVYVQGTQAFNVGISNTSGGNYEAVTATSTTTTTVTDDADVTTMTLTPSAASVTEGGSITYTATLSSAVTGTPVVLTLSNGQTITIPVGQTSGTSAPFNVRADDFYVQGTETLNVTVTNRTGGNFESLNTSATATTTVTDDADATVVTVTPSATTLAEGGAVAYTVAVNHPVTGSPFVVTLSNGQVLTIPVGQSSVTGASVAVRPDDAYAQGNQTVTVGINTTSGGNYEAVTTTSTASTVVTDDGDVTTVTVSSSAASVVEGTTVSYTVSVNNPVTGSPFAVTLSNGQTITIPVGQTSATGPAVATRPDDADIQGTQTITVGINSTSGGNFEAVNTASTTSTSVIDDADVTTMTLAPSAASVTEGGSITYTATLSNPVTGSPVVLTLSNGQTITIPVGQTSGTSAPFNVRADDFYVQGTETLNVTVTNRTGGNFESLNTSGTATTTVADDADATVVSVAASAANVVEGSAVSYTVTVNNPVTGTPFAVTLSNGQTITIPVGASSATGPAVVLRPDDVYVQGAQTFNVGINTTSGGNYEAVTTTSTASTTVTDDSDVTTMTLTPSAASVVEGSTITYTATLSNAVTGSPVVLTLSNGQTITIPVGQTTGTSAAFNTRADDAYVQGTQTLNVTVTGRTGGNFESLNTAGTATTTVTDDADATVVTVTPSAATVVEGVGVAYTVAVSNPVTGSPFTVTLSNGQTITIPVGQSSATGPAVVLRADDVYVQGTQTVNVGINSTSGGNYEAVTTTSTASTTVTDDSDVTTMTLTPSAASVVEGSTITYTATLSNAVTGSPVVLTLSNGQTITIPVGQTTGTSAAFSTRADDAYVQGTQTLNVTVTGRTGGNFESLNTAGTATTTVTDDADPTTVTVTASSANVVEGVGVAYTVSVNNPVTGSPFAVTLSNGQTITIPVGQSSATGPAVVLRADDVYVQGSQTVSVGINSTSGGNFEALTTTSTVSTTVTDDSDVTTMTLTPSAASVTEGGSITYTATLSNAVTGSPVVLTLSNGQTITIPVGQTTGFSAAFNVRADDAYVQGTETLNVTVTGRTGGNFESLNTAGTATTTVTDDADATVVTVTPSATTVVEGGAISYTVSVNNPVTGSPFAVTLSNGQTVTIPVGASSATGPALAVRPDDAYAQGNQTVAVTINGTSGGNYEAVTTTSTASTTVTDDADTTTISLTGTASLTEGGTATYTLTLSNPTVTPVTVSINYGGTAANGSDYTGVATVTIPAGASSVNFSVPTTDDTLDEPNETMVVSIGAITGTGGFEAIAAHPTNNSVTTTIVDNDPTPTLVIDDVSVNEAAGTATFTVTLSAASGQTVTVGYSTGNGTATAGSDYTATSGTLTFAPGQTTRTITVPITNDAIAEGNETFVVNLSSATNATIADAQGVGTIVDNDFAPGIDLDANNSSGATGANFNVTFTEGQTGVGIADTDATITDADSTLLQGATIILTNRQAGDALNLGNSVSGISASVNSTATTQTITLSGSASLANYLQAIRNIQFVNGSEDPSTTPRTVTVQVTDGANVSNLATTTINVVSVNDLPSGRDTTVTTLEDTAFQFGLSNFLMNDPEDGNNVNPAAVRIDSLPTNGTLYLNGSLVTAGQVITAAQISSGGLTFMPNPNDNGTNYASLTFSVRDSDGGFDAIPNIVTVNVTPVNDGAPVAAADSFRTVLGTPIIITQAQLLANDDLRDHARITGVSTATGGTLVNNGNGTYTFTPSATGNGTFTYTLTDDDGQTSTATVTIATSAARDDLATVHESALSSGTGGGTAIATGTLLANDGVGASTVTSVVYNGTTYNAVGGVITVNSALGQLVVQSNGSYTYTLQTNANNNTAATDLSVTEVFTYNSNVGSAALRVNIVDDKPLVSDHEVAVSQVPLPSYNLVLVLDISGSMTTSEYGGEVRRVNANGTTSITTRLAMAKEALAQLVTEYYNQASSVSIKIVTFADSATILNGNNAYTTLASTLSAINGITGTTSGGTNYQAALDATRTAYGTVNASLNNSTYFVSDGAPSTGNTATGLAAYTNFVNTYGIDSYGVGIGTGISNTGPLDSIHNVDADGNGVKDSAVIVPDLNQLGSSLLSTVPPAFGGNVVAASGTVAGNVLGADGGNIQTITMRLDSNNDGVPDQDVTFTYNTATNQITQNSSFLTGYPRTGDQLTLNPASGFGKGTLIFNFSTGSYTFYTNGTAAEGDRFGLSFVARDGDGDVTPSTALTFVVTNGAPVARPDTDTMQINETHLVGNVITGAGTDGGLALGTQVASFSKQGGGVDVAVDHANVNSVTFQGRAFDLTANSSGSGTGFTYTISNGQLTWTGTGANAGSVLVFNRSGFYDYTPPASQAHTTPHLAAVTNNFTSSALANANGVTLSSFVRSGAAGGINYATTGAGVTGTGSAGNNLENLERLVVTFSPTTHRYGVQNVSFNINAGASNLGPGTGALVGVIAALTYTLYDVAGVQIGQFYSSAEGNVTIPAEYGNIGRIEIEANSPAVARVSSVTYESITLDTTSAGPAPVEVGYTLVDDDGQSSSSTLTLNSITNNIYGTSGNDTLTGTNGNDRMLGGDGNDTLNGGAGHDILEGGLGNDVLNGGAGNDLLRGGEGSDTLDGGLGNDILIGGKGNDFLTGGDGSDVFKWEFGDQGVRGAPAVDTVTDFNNASASAGGDVLDLRDLLQGETLGGAATGNLTSYLHFDTSTVGNTTTTTIQISSNGGFSGGYNVGAVDQSITLQGVDLTAAGTYNTDQQIIQDLLNKSKLIVDG